MTTTTPTFNVSEFVLEGSARRIDKPWGYEILLSPPDAEFVLKHIYVRAGKRLSLQVHDAKTETQTLVSGHGILVLEGADGELHSVAMEPGKGYTVLPGQRHRLCAGPDQDALVYEASTPEIGTTYRLEDDYARPDETEARRALERA
jgi:mannose-6-phosphate isomerase-like protein (cupin superfamily)